MPANVKMQKTGAKVAVWAEADPRLLSWYYTVTTNCHSHAWSTMSPDEFKELIPRLTDSEIVTQVVLPGAAAHVTDENIKYLSRRIAETFGVDTDEIRLHVVGSAKLGFSLSEKRKNGTILRRYRTFGACSDIDLAIISARVFNMIWSDLSSYAYRNAKFMPWDSEKLGDYLVHGWLRPDHFPKARLPRCDSWNDLFRSLSSDRRFRKPVRGGLFYAESDMVSYYSRSVKECRLALELVR